MKAIKVHLVSRQFRALRVLVSWFRLRFNDRASLAGEATEALAKPLNELLVVCEDLGLGVGGIQARRVLIQVVPRLLAAISEASDKESFDGYWEAFDKDLRELDLTVEDELSLHSFFNLRPDQAALYESASPFGESVTGAFPSAQMDIEEAAKCIALDRGTAGVFHLMRVVEVGLRALGKSLKNPALDPKRNPSWEAILKKCDDQLALPIKDRCEEWKQDDAFFSDATANLRAVKNAWRNPTLHIERTYDPERALEVFQSVKGFMRHLAGRLSE